MGVAEMDQISQLVDTVLTNLETSGQTTYTIDQPVADRIKGQVRDLTARFPLH
jgi:glycine/serine hydroxymethyltransferase